jgi:hypothetical protein
MIITKIMPIRLAKLWIKGFELNDMTLQYLYSTIGLNKDKEGKLKLTNEITNKILYDVKCIDPSMPQNNLKWILKRFGIFEFNEKDILIPLKNSY